MNALVIGGVSIDTLIYTPEITNLSSDMSLFASRTSKQIGGTGAGKAFMLAKFDWNTTLVCQVSKEDEGYVTNELKSRGIQPVILQTNKTEKHTNIMHGENHRLSIFTSFPEDSNKINELVTDEMLSDADLIFLNINSFCKPLIARLEKHKLKVVVDIHDYQLGSKYHDIFFSYAGYLFSSCVYIENQVDFLKKSLKNYDLQSSVITCSKSGAVGIDIGDNTVHSPALKDIEVIDSNGAGDAFVVGFMYQYIKEKSLDDALLFGNVCGAFSCKSQELIDMGVTKKEILNAYKIEKNRL